MTSPTGTLSVGTLISGLSLGRTRSLPGIVTGFSPGFVIVAVPSSPTSTFVPVGRSGLAFLMLSSTCFFSSGVKWLTSPTGTLSVGTLSSGLSLGRTRSLPGIVTGFSPGFVIVAVPSSATSILVSLGRSGLAFLMLSSTCFFSSGVKWLTSPTGTLSVGTLSSGLSLGRTRSLPSISFADPSGNVTVVVPSGPTVTFVPSGKSGFAFLMLSSTCFFSSGVKFFTSSTGTFSSGILIPCLSACVAFGSCS